MGAKNIRGGRAGKGVDAAGATPPSPAGQPGTGDGGNRPNGDHGRSGGQSRSGRYATGFVDGEYQDAGVRGLVCVFGKRGSGKTTRAKQLIMGAKRVVVWDPVACCGDLGFPVLTQPGQLRDALAAAGSKGTIRVVYQPRSGDTVEHFEYVGWLCIKAQNIILMADEVDMVCSAGSSANAASKYWKTTNRMPALEQIVQFGRHSHVAFVGIARAPQDVWRRLTGQSLRILCFKMNERLELAALESRLGSNTAKLPTLGQYEYLDWYDGGEVKVAGGRL